MFKRDYRDIVGGAILFIGGTAFAWHASDQYNFGTLGRMGPGMFPFGLGLLLAAFGVALMVPAFFRRGSMPVLRFWSPLFVLTGVIAFSLTIRPFGLIPAIVALVVISSLAELRLLPFSLVALCAMLSLLAWLIFRTGLGLPLAMYNWPF